MMKKEYISPELLLTIIETQAFIAASKFENPTPTNQQDDQTITPTDTPYDGEFHSRRYNVWDDEEEQEEGL